MLLQIIDGSRPFRDAEDLPADFQCNFGVWLRFVQPSEDTKATLDDLRIWHAQWHAATNQIIDHPIKGDFAHVRKALSKRAGTWHYAGRKVDRCLEALWTTRTL